MRSTHLVGLLGLACLSLVSQAPGAGLGQPDETVGRPEASEQESRQSSLAAIRARIASLEDELGVVSAEAGDLLGSAGRTRIEVELQAARIAEAVAGLDSTRMAIVASTAEIGRLETALESARVLLGRRLVVMSSYGGGYLRLFLALNKGVEVLPALRLLRLLIRRDLVIVERYRAVRATLLRERGHLAARQAEGERWLAAERERRSELLELQRRQRRLLADLDARRERLVAATERLAVKESRLARLLDALADEGSPQLSGIAIEEFRGALGWPASGTVAVEFGPLSDPTYRTIVPHNGLEIETSSGSPVTAVYNGRVLFAATFQDLGYTVVLQHPGDVLTLYAGLLNVSVAEGDVVPLETQVGLASARLYFEIRVDRRPQDPREWLL